MAPDGTLIIRGAGSVNATGIAISTFVCVAVFCGGLPGDLSGKSDLPTTGELFEQAPSCKLRDASPLAGGSVKAKGVRGTYEN